jgi:hypothetical protein
MMRAPEGGPDTGRTSRWRSAKVGHHRVLPARRGYLAAILIAICLLVAGGSAIAQGQSKPNPEQLWDAYPLEPGSEKAEPPDPAPTPTAAPSQEPRRVVVTKPSGGGGPSSALFIVVGIVLFGVGIGAGALLRRQRLATAAQTAAALPTPRRRPARPKPRRMPAQAKPTRRNAAQARPGRRKPAKAKPNGRKPHDRPAPPAPRPEPVVETARPEPQPEPVVEAAPTEQQPEPVPAPAPPEPQAEPEAEAAAPAPQRAPVAKAAPRPRFVPPVPTPELELPSAERFARHRPWPDGVAGLWTCEIEWRPGYRKSRFRAMAAPPGASRRQAFGESAPVMWTLMSEPDPPTPEKVAVLRELMEALEDQGWDRVESAGPWYAQRLVWRQDGQPRPIAPLTGRAADA